jgi:hypothetical protein
MDRFLPAGLKRVFFEIATHKSMAGASALRHKHCGTVRALASGGAASIVGRKTGRKIGVMA